WGRGRVRGQRLGEHLDYNRVSSTGPPAVGRNLAATAGAGLKRVALELGGKSANVILPGADLTKAVKVGVGNAYLNAGQTCSAWTRMLVHTSMYDEAVKQAADAVAKYPVGDPFEPTTRIGPMVAA